jgi:hypothetical protein
MIKQILLNQLAGWHIIGILLLFFIIVLKYSGNSIGGKSVFIKDGTLDAREKGFLKSLLGNYFLWGFIQQLLCVILYTVLKYLFPNGQWNNVIIAVLFSFGGHSPNPVLTFGTFGMSLVLLQHYDIYGNVVAMGFIHGAIATGLNYFYPNKLIHSFSCWSGYVKYQKRMFPELFIKDYK